ncbi:MAG: hypothetical protein PSV22_00280 [Pseudolabrys sp.]|nr:hypothetical protein [Pseudolabrys sp.]
MKRHPLIAVGRIAVIALGAALGSAGLLTQGAAQTTPINPTVTNCNITPPNTAITSALLGQPLPCNPTLTIAALALRTADKILAREFGVTS